MPVAAESPVAVEHGWSITFVKPLRLPLPVNAEDERQKGATLTDYLWIGPLGDGPTYLPASSPAGDSATQTNGQPSAAGTQAP
jgi:hypothetical protein